MQVKKRYLFLLPILAVFFSTQLTFSQIGGESTYEFLNLPNSARIASMGGDYLAIYDKDITLALANPTVLPNMPATLKKSERLLPACNLLIMGNLIVLMHQASEMVHSQPANMP